MALLGGIGRRLRANLENGRLGSGLEAAQALLHGNYDGAERIRAAQRDREALQRQRDYSSGRDGSADPFAPPLSVDGATLPMPQADPAALVRPVAPIAAPAPAQAPWQARMPAMDAVTQQRESGNRDHDSQGRVVTSPRGAIGRMQVMPGTNRNPGFGVPPAQDDSLDERARVGRDYLGAMMQRYGGDPARAWAAYNMGPGALDRVLSRHGDSWRSYLPRETRDYVEDNLRQLGGQQP